MIFSLHLNRIGGLVLYILIAAHLPSPLTYNSNVSFLPQQLVCCGSRLLLFQKDVTLWTFRFSGTRWLNCVVTALKLHTGAPTPPKNLYPEPRRSCPPKNRGRWPSQR